MRRRKPPPQPSHERWLVSYADFITLLFAFFTTLYAISTVDAQKLTAMVESMQSAFASQMPASADRPGPGPGAGAMPQKLNLPNQPISPRPGDLQKKGETDDGAAEPVSVDEVRARLLQQLDQQIASGLLDIEVDPRGLVVSIREAGSFPTGKAELSAVVEHVLSEIATALRGVGNFVRVEGHTDNVPIHTDRFKSNWELSTARATNVVALLLAGGLHPRRLSAAGYAEFHPRVSNDTDGNRARNRRIDIVVLNPLTGEREEPGQQPRGGTAP
jgi:chemotaxis protein MotB